LRGLGGPFVRSAGSTHLAVEPRCRGLISTFPTPLSGMCHWHAEPDSSTPSAERETSPMNRGSTGPLGARFWAFFDWPSDKKPGGHRLGPPGSARRPLSSGGTGATPLLTYTGLVKMTQVAGPVGVPFQAECLCRRAPWRRMLDASAAPSGGGRRTRQCPGHRPLGPSKPGECAGCAEPKCSADRNRRADASPALLRARPPREVRADSLRLRVASPTAR